MAFTVVAGCGFKPLKPSRLFITFFSASEQFAQKIILLWVAQFSPLTCIHQNSYSGLFFGSRERWEEPMKLEPHCHVSKQS
jgi:hypothetical protein